MKQKGYLFMLSLAILTGCNQGKVSQQNAKNGEKPEPVIYTDTFRPATLPEIPSILTDPEQQAEFLADHYWDKSDFTDSCYLTNPDIAEQAWVDYLNVLDYVSPETAQKVIKKVFMQSAFNKEVFKSFTDLANKYLYDPNSPMRNEEYYIPVLEAMIASPILDETEKIRPQDRLNLARKNRPGTKALDFTYTLASGTQGTLHGISADYTILFFNNPGCHACAEAIDGMKKSSVINQLLSESRLKILAFYTDTELDEWRKHRPDFPDAWLNGYDKNQMVTDKNLYDLKAIPTFYLMDKEKTVILKDAALQSIVIWLLKKNSDNATDIR